MLEARDQDCAEAARIRSEFDRLHGRNAEITRDAASYLREANEVRDELRAAQQRLAIHEAVQENLRVAVKLHHRLAALAGHAARRCRETGHEGAARAHIVEAFGSLNVASGALVGVVGFRHIQLGRAHALVTAWVERHAPEGLSRSTKARGV